MEIRNVVIGTGVVLAIGVLGLSLYEPQERGSPLPARPAARQTQAETRPAEAPPQPGLEETLTGLLPRLEDADEASRRSAVGQIGAAMESGGSKELTPETRERVAVGLIAAYTAAKDETPEGIEFKRSIVRTVVGRVGGKAATGFAAEVLEKGTDTVKTEAVKALLIPGAVRGGEVYEKALELARAGPVPDEIKPAVFRKILGKKAEPELMTLFAKDIGPAAVKACAVELQNLNRHELMGAILARLEEKGLLVDAQRMPWISGRLLADHIRNAGPKDLELALKVAKSRPSLTKATAKSLKERLSDSDPIVRGMVARAIAGAVGNKGLDPESGEDLLASRLKEESDPAVKGAIEDSLAQVRLARQPQEAPKAPEPARTP